jgi:hypothetical protein
MGRHMITESAAYPDADSGTLGRSVLEAGHISRQFCDEWLASADEDDEEARLFDRLVVQRLDKLGHPAALYALAGELLAEPGMDEAYARAVANYAKYVQANSERLPAREWMLAEGLIEEEDAA